MFFKLEFKPGVGGGFLRAFTSQKGPGKGLPASGFAHIREVMEQHKDFVLIKVDKKNAFNEIKRASVVRALAKMPGFEAFARFAFLHLDPVSDIVAGTGPDTVMLRFKSEEGGQQGDPAFPLRRRGAAHSCRRRIRRPFILLT